MTRSGSPCSPRTPTAAIRGAGCGCFSKQLRTAFGLAYKYPPVPRRGYPIEHVLPQKWETHWSVEGLQAQLDRGAHVHRLGNLTLLTEGLNSAVSNSAWSAKREKLAKHDVFLMNRHFRDLATERWDEDDDRRSVQAS